MKRLVVKMLCVVLALSLAFLSCESPSMDQTAVMDPNKATLALNFKDEVKNRTFLPGISMEIATFEIYGDGPGIDEFREVITLSETSTLSLTEVTIGSWYITVSAFNSDNIRIGAGSSSATVYAGDDNHADIVVSPLGGNGTARINVRWNEDTNVLNNPSISGRLVPRSGSVYNLGFSFIDENGNSVIPGNALRAYTSRSLPAGYYTNIVLLYENSTLAAGGVEVIRILAGHDTVGNFEFDPDPARGSLDVNVALQMNDPLELTISGAQTQMASTDYLTLSGQVGNLDPNVNVIYVWYDNGIYKSEGQTFVYDQPIPGKHRIDLTAFTADGSQAGSTTYYINVVDDLDIPEVSVDSLTNNIQPEWSWNAVTNAEMYRYRLDEGPWTSVDSSNTSFTSDDPMGDGTYTLDVQAGITIDGGLVWSGIGSASTTIDTTAPAIPVISGEITTINTRPTWTWEAIEDAVLYSYSLDSAVWVETEDLYFTPSVDLSYADHNLEVRAMDAAGNWSSPNNFMTRVD